MELKRTFNLKTELYDELRPNYSPKLYQDIFEYIELNSESNLLEIGIGTGQATMPFIEKKCNITAVELGENLAMFTKEKFKMYPNLSVVLSDFESVNLMDNKYDLIYSASAFHWIKPEVGLPKVYNALKEIGVFAWISTPPCPWKENGKLFNELQSVYRNFSQYFGGKSNLTLLDVDNRIAKDIKYKQDVLNQYKFNNIISKQYMVKKVFSSEDYLRLIDTYSDHSVIPKQDKQEFYSQIKEVIDKNGGYIMVHYTNVLVLGQK